MGECAYVDITMPVAEVEAFFEVKMERFRNKFFPDQVPSERMLNDLQLIQHPPLAIQVILRSPREETIPAAISSQVSYIAGLSRFPGTVYLRLNICVSCNTWNAFQISKQAVFLK